MGNKIVRKFKSEGVNEYQCNLFRLYPFRIIKAICNRLNLRLSQKTIQLDTFLIKLCSNLCRNVSSFLDKKKPERINANFFKLEKAHFKRGKECRTLLLQSVLRGKLCPFHAFGSRANGVSHVFHVS